MLNGYLASSLTKPGMSRGFGTSRHYPANAHAEQATHRQCKDVIKRQRGHNNHLLDRLALTQGGLQPGLVLEHVSDDVTVEQRCTLRDTGGAPVYCRNATSSGLR